MCWCEAKKAQQEAKKAKTLCELVEPYLKLRETVDEFWKPLRPEVPGPKSHVEVTDTLSGPGSLCMTSRSTYVTHQMVGNRRNETGPMRL